VESNFYAEALNWKGHGYFVSPVSSTDPRLKNNPDAALWLEVQAVLEDSRSGEFSKSVSLLKIHDQTQSGLLKWVCAQLLGDAGTTPCFTLMIQDLEESLDPDKAVAFCNALGAWGGLSAVPAIVQSYERHFGFQDVEALPFYLSTMLEMEWGPLAEKSAWENPDTYVGLAMARYEVLKQKFGTDQVILLHGERFGVVWLARRMLRSLGDSSFEKVMQPFYRRRLEASTGIDCSGFYKDRNFQPLTAAAILEDFLESPEAARYEEGVRYFFGHRIPEG